jgi:hypothetical protein
MLQKLFNLIPKRQAPCSLPSVYRIEHKKRDFYVLTVFVSKFIDEAQNSNNKKGYTVESFPLIPVLVLSSSLP